MKYYVGVDIGGTRIKLGIINSEGKVCAFKNIETPPSCEEIMNEVLEFIKEQDQYPIESVGISTPGVVKDDGYMQTSGAIKCFFNKNMKAEFEQFLNLKVHVENDGKCAASGEKWVGGAKDVDNFVCLTLGTAIGGAIYINGQIYRGLGGMAGEFGVSLVGLENDNYEQQSFAYHAATIAGLCRQYSYKVKERVLDAQEIIKRAEHGDLDAHNCLEDFYHSVAVLLVNVTSIIAPEVVFIGGGISSNDMVMNNIYKAFDNICEQYHILSLVDKPLIKTCQLKNDAGMIGAVYPLIKGEE